MHEIAYWLGLTNASGSPYLWWSGFAADLPLFGGAWVLYRRHQCHTGRCWRVGLHHEPATGFVTCRRHHPNLRREMEKANG